MKLKWEKIRTQGRINVPFFNKPDKNTAEILNNYKYQKKGGSSFSKSARQGIVNKSLTPGPGN